VGAWGSGPFENDDALDWVASLVGSSGEATLVEAFAQVALRDDQYLEAPDASVAVAAAEVVATARGAPGAGLPSAVDEWITSHKNEVTVPTAELARSAMERVASNSELAEVWEESDSSSEWRATIESLQQRLADVA